MTEKEIKELIKQTIRESMGILVTKQSTALDENRITVELMLDDDVVYTDWFYI